MNEVEKLRGLLTRCDEYLAEKGVIRDAKLRREIRAALSQQCGDSVHPNAVGEARIKEALLSAIPCSKFSGRIGDVPSCRSDCDCITPIPEGEMPRHGHPDNCRGLGLEHRWCPSWENPERVYCSKCGVRK